MKINVERAIKGFARDVVADAKRSVPVVTGRLRDSIDFNLIYSSDELKVEFVMEDYGRFVDAETNHFWTNAVDSNLSFLRSDLEKATKQDIEEELKRIAAELNGK